MIDGFRVQRTTDIRDSVVFLTLLTRQLSTHYAVSIYIYSTTIVYTNLKYSQARKLP